MIGIEQIRAAQELIRTHIKCTPVVRCASIDDAVGAQVFLKCENLQAAGVFKSRGASNAVFSLSEACAARGVVTHSSGNHAAALSRAASRRGIPAFIVMPTNARRQKIEAVKSYGGRITFCEPTLPARERTADQVMRETGGSLIHPYDDDQIIAGQGTAAIEFLEEVPDLDILITPVGGGGLLSGTAIAAKAMRSAVEVWGAEPRGADDAYRSWKSGRWIPMEAPRTIADGLLTSLGQRNFAILQKCVDDILLTGDDTIVRAVRLLYEQAQLLVEPSGAVPLAVLLENQLQLQGKRVGLILSGGNFDIADLPDPS